ncbi:MAG: hypothetical protein KME20_28485 [Kaiparowitsia implicata GSE-PSE-MK54-09C]|jgi:hypothetical protein|nr:hypothetical protein [Kaiparowitsia implicata GSE-PSE-MK54-09C]
MFRPAWISIFKNFYEGYELKGDWYSLFIRSSLEELSEKQAALERVYGVGDYSRWSFDQITRRAFHLLDENRQVVVEAEVVSIGNYYPRSNKWEWSWNDTSLLPDVREQARRLKGLESYTGVPIFGYKNAFEISGEAMAWELAAMAIKYIRALGCYRTPSPCGGLHSFLAINSISKNIRR